MTLRNIAVAVLVAFVPPTVAAGGGQDAQRPAFEVVSIRPVKPAPGEFILPGGVRLIGDRLRASNISARGLVHAAYATDFPRPDQIISADGWIASERFDVEARAAGVLVETPTSPPLPPAAALMLQQLLERRFQLRVRRETREIPTLVLTYARADKSLKQGIRVSAEDCTGVRFTVEGKCAPRFFAGNLMMRGRPIQEFVEYLSRPAYAGGIVADQTGITGLVDIDFTWMLDWQDLLASRANLMTALQEQLGLKLENRRLRMPVLVIEHIERPSQN